jgi:hypothetical protein
MLADGLVRLENAGLHPIGHVHDEAITEAPRAALADLKPIMLAHPDWAVPFGVDVEADTLTRYRKL